MQANQAKNKHTLYFHITPPKVKIIHYHKKVFLSSTIFQNNFHLPGIQIWNFCAMFHYSMNLLLFQNSFVSTCNTITHNMKYNFRHKTKCKKCNSIKKIIEQNSFVFSNPCKPIISFLNFFFPEYFVIVSFSKILIPLKVLLQTESKSNNKY